jgi:capsular exopolysaccharide synthesis family protein
MVNDVDASFGFTEQHKKVASRIITAANERKAKAIMLTSVREHEGKSNVAANLALTLAKQNYSVLLIDLDLRRPTQYQLFDVQEVTDLPEVIHDNDRLNKAMVKKDGLSLLLSKGQYENSTELIADRSMANLIARAKQVYDFIIIDTPPMGVMSDAEVVADFTDMSVMVVQYNNVQAKDINDAIDELNKGRAYFAGVILNGLWEAQGRGSVMHGYGAYGKYGRYGKYGHYAERKTAGSSGVKA